MALDSPKWIHRGFFYLLVSVYFSRAWVLEGWFTQIICDSRNRIQKRQNTSFSEKENEKLQFYTTVWELVYRRDETRRDGQREREKEKERERERERKSPFKNDEKGFLFQLKSSFRSQDIQVLVLTFSSCIETGRFKR